MKINFFAVSSRESLVRMDDCISDHEEKILNKNLDINVRIRSLFYLRNVDEDSSAYSIAKALYDNSELLAHEAAYCLGQMGRKCVVPHLINVLSNSTLPVVVRHEAGEALGAINDPSCLDVLIEYSNDPQIEVAETCQIATDRILYFQNLNEAQPDCTYGSTDPSPPHISKDVNLLEFLLLDESKPLFERYKAMFALRNIGSDQCVKSLSKGFGCKGALFKHEIAFVFGQMRHEKSIDALTSVLEDKSEHSMVRHECAEALGNIATPICTAYLKTCLSDKEIIVKESCQVALGIASYQNSNQFQYVES